MAVQDMSVAKYTTGEQNKEIAKARQHCDMKYTHTLLYTIPVCPSLRNIMTGVNANGDVDVFDQKQIGQKMVDSTSGVYSRSIHKRIDYSSIKVITANWCRAGSSRPRSSLPAPHRRIQRY